MSSPIRTKIYTINGKQSYYNQALIDHYSSHFNQSILEFGELDQKEESIHYRVIYMSSNNIDIGYTLTQSLGINKDEINTRQQNFINHTLNDLSFDEARFEEFIVAYYDIVQNTGFCTTHNRQPLIFEQLFQRGVDKNIHYCNFSNNHRLFTTRFKPFLAPLSRTMDIYSNLSIKKHLIDGVLKTGLSIDLPIDFCKRKKNFSILFGRELTFIHTQKGHEYRYTQDQALALVKEHLDKVGSRVISRHFKLSMNEVLLLSPAERLRHLDLIEMSCC